VPKIVEHLNDNLFIDNYKSNKIKIDPDEMKENDSEMDVMIW